MNHPLHERSENKKAPVRAGAFYISSFTFSQLQPLPLRKQCHDLFLYFLFLRGVRDPIPTLHQLLDLLLNSLLLCLRLLRLPHIVLIVHKSEFYYKY
jgi:hypothetical protein